MEKKDENEMRMRKNDKESLNKNVTQDEKRHIYSLANSFILNSTSLSTLHSLVFPLMTHTHTHISPLFGFN